MVTEDLQQPRFMYREKRSWPEDSGWRIFTGMESEDYLDDPANCAIYRPETVIAIDPSVELLLQSGIGSVYERNDDNFWERVTDFPLEDDFSTTQRLDGGWELTLNNLFERQDEEGEAYFTTGDKSVRITVWEKPGQDREALSAWIREEIANRDGHESEVQEQFEFYGNGARMLGYTVVEQDERRVYQVLYAWSLRDEAFAFMSFYFDDPADQDWALETWKSVVPSVC